jgi:hypothetical protein
MKQKMRDDRQSEHNKIYEKLGKLKKESNMFIERERE